MPYVTLKNGNRIEALDEFTGESKSFEFDTEKKKVLADFGDGSEPEEIGGMTAEQAEELNQAVADIAKLKTDVARAESKADIAGEVANSKLDNSMHSHTEGKVPVANENGQLVDSFITNANIATNAGIETSKLAFTSQQTEVLNSGINSAKVAQIQSNSENISSVESTANHADSEAERIGKLIPSTATESNQLADKNFVNSSIATSTATFRGTFNSFAELEAYSGEKDDNDYAFVAETSGSATVYKRYKYNGSTWEFEYQLNNSSFTSEQWATINSGATASTVAQVETNKNNIAANSNSITTLNASASTTGSVANKIATALASAGDGNTIGSNSGGKLESIGLLNANGGAPIKIWEGTEASWTNYENKTYDKYVLVANGIFKDASGMLPAHLDVTNLGYGLGNFYLFGVSSDSVDVAYMSTDGVTWNELNTLPAIYDFNWVSEANGILYAGRNYSIDGITWNEISGLTSRGSISNVVYADDNSYYVMVGGTMYKSTDGISFTSLISYSDGHASKLLYANGVFAIVTYTQSGSSTKKNYKLHYGTNPKSLASIDLGTESNIKHTIINSLVYGNGKYLCTYTIQRTGGSAIFEYHILTSSDGINWSDTINNKAGIGNLVFFDGYFLSEDSYSVDGLNWFDYYGHTDLMFKSYAASPTKLMLCDVSTDFDATYVEAGSLPQDLAGCYFEGTPTVGATVYKDPGVLASETITNVDGNTIILSNDVAYGKNGDVVAINRTVADAHPDWLCNIENVGVKFGNKLIADATGSLVVDQIYNAESVNAQSGVAIAGAGFASASSLATVATTGSYTDLSNKPTIPAITDTYSAESSDGMSGKAVASAISGKADSSSLATVATSGNYDDLSNKPTIPVVDQSYSASSANAQSGVAVAQAITASGSKSKSDCFVTTMTYESSRWTGTSDSALLATYPYQATKTAELSNILYNAANKVSAYVSFSGADAISGKYAPVAKVDSFDLSPNQGARVTVYATEAPSTNTTIDVTVFLEYGA